MEGIINLPLFFISSIMIIIAPGPDFIYVTTRSISDGNKAGILSAIGVCVGLLIHTMFAAFGLSAIIQTSRVAYLIIKYIGAAYLIYIGIKAIITKANVESSNVTSLNKNGKIFKQAVLTNIFNPKAIVTFMAFLPQFVEVNVSNHISQFLCLGCIFSLMAILWFGLIGYFAGTAGGFLKRNKSIQSIMRYISGTIMIALG
ncbi:MAG TPA: LysE family translocator, partial [Caldithrix sp.]|nr:LysE family translocator [Caldithrix sp.]